MYVGTPIQEIPTNLWRMKWYVRWRHGYNGIYPINRSSIRCNCGRSGSEITTATKMSKTAKETTHGSGPSGNRRKKLHSVNYQDIIWFTTRQSKRWYFARIFYKVEEIANLPNVAATVVSSNEGMRTVRCIISDQPWIATPYPGIVQWLFG